MKVNWREEETKMCALQIKSTWGSRKRAVEEGSLPLGLVLFAPILGLHGQKKADNASC